jgi:hypothetical protein
LSASTLCFTERKARYSPNGTFLYLKLFVPQRTRHSHLEKDEKYRVLLIRPFSKEHQQ